MTDKEALVAMLKRVGVEVEGTRAPNGIRAYANLDSISLNGDYAGAEFHFDANGMLVKMRLES